MCNNLPGLKNPTHTVEAVRGSVRPEKYDSKQAGTARTQPSATLRTRETCGLKNPSHTVEAVRVSVRPEKYDSE